MEWAAAARLAAESEYWRQAGERAAMETLAPVQFVGRQVAVDKLFHEIALAPLPVDEQVLREKHRHDHPQAVVHGAGGVEVFIYWCGEIDL